MCFLVEEGTKYVEKSDNDIIVYKYVIPLSWKFLGIRLPWFLTKSVMAPITGYLYSKRRVQETEELNKVGATYTAYNTEGNRVIETRQEINQGYHSFSRLNKARRERMYGTAVYEFIIPAGSEYYYNPFREEYVSSNLLFKNTIPLTFRK